MFLKVSSLDYLRQNHLRDMLKICISKFRFNITGMRLEILDFLQNPSSCHAKWRLWNPAHVSSKNSIKGTWSHCSDQLQMSWDVAIKAPPSMNTGCKILPPDIFKDNNRYILKEEGCLNITMCRSWFSSKWSSLLMSTSYQHSQWVSLLRCLLLQVKSKLMNTNLRN